MYADRYARPEGIKPGSLTVAIAINGALIGALLFAAPVITRIKDPVLTIKNIPIDPPPPTQPIKPEAKPRPHQQTAAVRPRPDVSSQVTKADSVYVAPWSDPAGASSAGGGAVDIVIRRRRCRC